MQSKASFPVKHPASVNEDIRCLPYKSTSKQCIYTQRYFINVLIKLLITYIYIIMACDMTTVLCSNKTTSKTKSILQTVQNYHLIVYIYTEIKM